MDPEGDHEESQENGKGYGLHDRREPAGFRAEGVRCRAQVYAPVRRLLLRRWGFTRKVPLGRHVRRANRQKIAWFRKKLKPLIEEKTKEGYAVAMQDEAIVIAEARARSGIYTPKGVRGSTRTPAPIPRR